VPSLLQKWHCCQRVRAEQTLRSKLFPQGCGCCRTALVTIGIYVAKNQQQGWRESSVSAARWTVSSSDA